MNRKLRRRLYRYHEKNGCADAALENVLAPMMINNPFQPLVFLDSLGQLVSFEPFIKLQAPSSDPSSTKNPGVAPLFNFRNNNNDMNNNNTNMSEESKSKNDNNDDARKEFYKCYYCHHKLFDSDSDSYYSEADDGDN